MEDFAMEACNSAPNMLKWGCYTVTSPAFSLLSYSSSRHLLQHVFDENAVSRSRIIYKDMGNSAHQLAVLDDGAAAQ